MRWGTAALALGLLLAAPVARADDVRRERSVLVEAGAGPSVFTMLRARDKNVRELGGAFHLSTRIPIGHHFGVGVRLGWGLTSWKRTEKFGGAGVRLARNITEFLGDGWGNVLESDGVEELAGNTLGAVIVSFVSLIPYAVAGLIIATSPVAATSSIESALTFDYEPAREPRYGPFLRAGGALLYYIDPTSGRGYAGAGPSAGAGFRFGKMSLSMVGTFVPTTLRSGEANRPTEHVLTTSLMVGIVR